MAKPVNPDADVWHRWKSELDFAQKDKKYCDWLERSAKIIARYRDERKSATERAKRRMNILWSNVETLRPAVYAKMPKPVVERRFMDRDPAARLASTILERCLSVQMEVGYFHESTKQAVLDFLLPAMGQVWLRYEPQFEPSEIGAENKKIEGEEQSAEDVQEEGDGTPYEKLSSERTCVDYVLYKDFLWGPARFWREVPWVGRRSWLTHSEIAEKFYAGDMAKAKLITLDYTPETAKDKSDADQTASYFKKAEIWEIWNKADQTVYFIAPGTPDVVLKKEPKPVLKLEGFWPCPEPLFATQTNDTIVPVPDYIEYQDQAQELDDLTGRIAALTTALRANGVYDASVPALARLLADGQDNKLIPVDQWAAFAEKGGMKGAIDLVPIKEIADVLIGLYQARQQVKNDLYEVTGMADIVRGQSEGSAKTATEQRIKGQFASMRLEDRRSNVARFCRDTLCIQAEIISEMFSDDSLMQMSGYMQIVQEDIRKAVEAVPPPQPPQMPEGSPPPPPEQQQAMQAQMQQQHQMAQQQAAQQAQEKALGEFQAAVAILRSDKLRGFRVDIETDSTIAADAEQDKASAIELVKGTMEGLTAAGPVIQMAPELAKPIGGLLMFAYRRFRVGRTVEAELEDALDQINERIEAQKGQPTPPSPEEVKAQAEMQKQQMETERLQMKAKLEAEAQQAQLAADRERNQMEMAALKAKTEATIAVAQMSLQVKQQEMEMKERELGMKERELGINAAIKEREMAMGLEASEREHEMNRESADHQHQLGMETMDAKAKAAKQSASAKPNGAKA